MKIIIYLVIAFCLICALIGLLSILTFGGIFGNFISDIFGSQSYKIFIVLLVIVAFGMIKLIKYTFGAINSF